jgi:hypothetical protein
MDGSVSPWIALPLLVLLTLLVVATVLHQLWAIWMAVAMVFHA